MAKNIHREPFDDGTKLKLDIFKGYLKEWLPVFIAKSNPYWTKINVFDFFAGPGLDVDGSPGSPMIVIEEILSSEYNGVKYSDYLHKNGLKLGLYFNEFVKPKFSLLKENLLQYKRDQPFFIKETNLEFTEAFEGAYPIISNPHTANLLFLDQNGVKQITEDRFHQLIALQRTDFIGFISSSFLNRFGKHESFKKYLNVHEIDFEGKPYFHCHQVVVDYYKSLVPPTKDYFIAPFSIKKGKNIYGLMFGSNHSLGMEKFLKICWSIDPQRGQANYDIDNEKIDPDAPSLFPQFNVPKRLQVIERDILRSLRQKKILGLKELYLFGLQNGFLPKHLNKIIKIAAGQGIIKLPSALVANNIHKLDTKISLRYI